MDATEAVYSCVQAGELAIDRLGRIWRMVSRRGIGRGAENQVAIHAHPVPVRAERKVPLGYLQVRSVVDGVRFYAGAHRLVWRHFHGSIPEGLTINHINGAKADNRPENLELATMSEQAIHARRVLGRCPQDGERNNHSKLTVTDIKAIRARRASGEKLKEIAKDFGVTDRAISKIARMSRWASVG